MCNPSEVRGSLWVPGREKVRGGCGESRVHLLSPNSLADLDGDLARLPTTCGVPAKAGHLANPHLNGI